uniref:SJCHGC06182 protein n=1 Tax=Schistosoma japonicum TaxID=6182 RepID=Q5D8Q2_SCHJA|nr:SJCHGC06182 protein [Schistosoma japonicum]
MGNVDPNYSHMKFEESLLSWATSCGFSHSHARRLLELGVQKKVFSCENLEQNKLILLNLLHTFNSLLTTFSTSQSSHKFSEQSALLIAVTFPNDLSKAQQLARLVTYLEQNGFSQDIICQYIQNPESKENEAVVKFLNNLTICTNAPHNVSPVNLLFSTPRGMKSPEK